MVQIEEDIPEESGSGTVANRTAAEAIGEEKAVEADIDAPAVSDLLPSQERLLDAHDLERAAAALERPTARLHLTALVTKLRREAEALQRIEKSRRLSSSSSPSPPASPSQAAKTVNDDEGTNENLAPSTGTTKASTASTATASTTSSPPPAPRGTYVPVDRFAFDAGGYNAPFVTLYIDLPGVGSIDRSQITCHFTKTSVDLVVRDLKGQSHRLYKDNLEKDINPDQSKVIVKADKILIKLAKIKSEYGSYDHWSQLSAKKSRTAGTSSSSKNKDDPQQSIMQLMKDMYDDGDDNMRKIIGETMLKQRTGELGAGGNNKNDPLSGMGMGGRGFGGDDEDF